MQTKKCRICGGEFETGGNGRYCSSECKKKAYYIRLPIKQKSTGVCVVCGGEFKTHCKERKFCSKQCNGKVGNEQDKARQVRTEYNSWRGMVERCNYPKNKKYHNYGGRGIKVHAPWVASFETFLADMGNKPTPKHELDRIDNDGDYTPENCRWITHLENIRNRSDITLSMPIVREIRRLYAEGGWTQKQLADKFGTWQTTVSSIILGKAWQEVPSTTTM